MVRRPDPPPDGSGAAWSNRLLASLAEMALGASAVLLAQGANPPADR
jgi:hypothetical protein